MRLVALGPHTLNVIDFVSVAAWMSFYRGVLLPLAVNAARSPIQSEIVTGITVLCGLAGGFDASGDGDADGSTNSRSESQIHDHIHQRRFSAGH